MNMKWKDCTGVTEYFWLNGALVVSSELFGFGYHGVTPMAYPASEAVSYSGPDNQSDEKRFEYVHSAS